MPLRRRQRSGSDSYAAMRQRGHRSVAKQASWGGDGRWWDAGVAMNVGHAVLCRPCSRPKSASNSWFLQDRRTRQSAVLASCASAAGRLPRLSARFKQLACNHTATGGSAVMRRALCNRGDVALLAHSTARGACTIDLLPGDDSSPVSGAREPMVVLESGA